ncbi:zinc ribbon domain-containing protein [Arthrobacter sp. TMN-49]
MAGVGAYFAVLIVSLVVSLLAVIGMATGGSGSSVAVPDNPFISDGQLPSPWTVLFQLAAQLPAMGMIGSLGGRIDADLGAFGAINMSVGIIALPLLITAAAIAALVIAGRLAEKRLPSTTTADRVMQSVVSGAAFSLFLNVVATAASLRIPVMEDVVLGFNAVDFSSIAVSALVGAVASFAGRSSVAVPSAGKKGFVVSLVRDAGLTLTLHAGIILVVAIPAAIIVMGVENGWAASLSAPLWAPTAGLLLLGLGHFAAFGTATAAGMGSAGMGKSTFGYGMGGSLADFGFPAWAGWLLVLLVLVATVAAATYWYLRRGAKNPTSISGWVALPAAFLVFGALVLWLTSIHASFSMSQGAGGASMGLAWWTPFLMVLWGAAMEVASRYLAPAIAPLLPTALVARVQKSPSILSKPLAGAAGSSPVEQHQTQPQQFETGAAARPGAPVLIERTPLSKKQKRNLIIAGGAVALVAVLVGGGAIAVNTVRGANGPDKVIDAYLQALVSGDAERALEISDPSIPNAQRVLLTNEIYGKATKRPDGFTILKTTMGEEQANVQVELRQNGEKVETNYVLVKSDPSLLDDHWKLKETKPGTVTISSSSSLSSVLVNGFEVSLAGLAESASSSYSSYQLPAFPGNYDLDLPSSSKYLSAEPAAAVVSIHPGNSHRSVELALDTNDAFDKAVGEKVSALLAKCSEQKTLEPVDCPFSTYEYSDTRNVSWKTTTEPVIETYPDMDGGWRLRTSTTGKATASFERDTSYGSDSPKWEKKTYDSQIYVSGTATVDKDELSVEFSEY